MKLNIRNVTKNGVGRPEWGALTPYHSSLIIDSNKREVACIPSRRKLILYTPAGRRKIFFFPDNSLANEKLP